MAASASASFSQVRREKYDVFISFRGPDTRREFLSHLLKELHQNHIDEYVDERLEKGEEISSALVEAIEASTIALVILSEHYASSRWCLDELIKIMECKETNNQIVMPVFYNIHPSHVRHQRGSYADAFAKHEEKFRDNTEKLQFWRSALTKIADLSGYHYPSKEFKNESEFIGEIVENILKTLATKFPMKSRDHKLLVGIYRNFSKVRSLMRIEPKQVRFLGIWGTGGIGKTTLALEIFDNCASQFQCSCFLENVRAKSKEIDGFKHLHQELLSQLLNQTSLHVNAAIRRLQRKQVLIVLDDVDSPMQIKNLAIVEKTYLGWGSRVIITSRDKHVLKDAEIDEEYIHEVKELNFEESLELFSLNAFKQNNPKTGYEELSKRTVTYAKGIPLALEVLGRHFSCRSEKYWKSELRKLRKHPKRDIQNILKVSYDGLHNVDQQIFLDIAFFFLGEQKDKVTSVLEACDFEAASGIENLIDKALIKISDERIIKMHDLLHDMGEQIVREESPQHPEERSRLNDSKEICDVLKNNMGTKQIQGITMDVTQIKDVQLRADTFTRMKKLRIIKFYSNHGGRMESHIKLPHDLESLPKNLRYFQWDLYPSKSLPLGFCPKNIVELRLEYSNLRRLWDGVQDLPNLEMINLSGSKRLKELPDFSMTRKLETVFLDFCKNLRSVHSSIFSHTLVNLDVSYCSKLEILESEANLKSLSDLRVDGCGRLKRFCLSIEKVERLDLLTSKIETLHLPIVGQLTELRELYLNGSRLMNLPINELRYFTNLERFRLDDFHQVIHKTELEILFTSWRCLRCLYLHSCIQMSEIPENISALTELEHLSLSECGVEILPASMQHVPNLRQIYLNKCTMLRCILGLPRILEKLEATDCTSLETIFCSSRFAQESLDDGCRLNFKNCAKLDEPSLVVIEKLIQCSIISAAKRVDSCTACYSGSEVPNWVRYKQMEVMASSNNTVEFTCIDEQSLVGIVFCCVLPSTPMDMAIWCNYSDDNNLRFKSHYHKVGYCTGGCNSDHVFIWNYNFSKRSSGRESYRVACEFCATCTAGNDIESIDSEVSIKACGVCPVYASETKLLLVGEKRKRDARVDGTVSLRKQKHCREIQFL